MKVQSLRVTLPQTAGILKVLTSKLQSVQKAVQNQTASSVKQLVSIRV